jgi:predicted Fe-Mo cluster-binding NifX family protein
VPGAERTLKYIRVILDFISKEDSNMSIAIAATAPERDGQIAMHGARAPFYLLFDKRGDMLEAVANPVVQVAGGAAPKAAQFLEEKGVTLLAAGDFGDTFIAELEERGIRHARLSGSISDAVAELIG